MNSDLMRPACAKLRGARTVASSRQATIGVSAPELVSRARFFEGIGSGVGLRGKKIAESPILAVQDVIGGTVRAVRFKNGGGAGFGRGHGADGVTGRSKRPGRERAENRSAERGPLLARMHDNVLAKDI